MPGTNEQKLYGRFTSGQKYSDGIVGFFTRYWSEGDPVFSGYHVWDNRFHRGDGPLFHAISQTPPPDNIVVIRGKKYLFTGERVLDDGAGLHLTYGNGRYCIFCNASYKVQSDGTIRTSHIACSKYAGAFRGYILGTPYGDFGSVTDSRYYTAYWGSKGEILTYMRTHALSLEDKFDFKGEDLSNYLYDAWVSPFPSDLAQMSFQHNEYYAYLGWKELGIDGLPNLYRSGFASAYVNAMQDIPEIRCNMIANILDVISAIKGLKKGNFLEDVRRLAKDPRKAWLSYRYAYSTTKMDVQEVSSAISRIKQIIDLGADFQVRGTYKRGNMTFRACANIPVSQVLPDPTLVSKLDKLGIKLSAYNTWDLIPYSFVVDWFLKVGDLLEWAEGFNEALEVKVSDVWYSCQTITDDLVVYFRISASGITGLPFYDTVNASNKTILMRFTDALALFS